MIWLHLLLHDVVLCCLLAAFVLYVGGCQSWHRHVNCPPAPHCASATITCNNHRLQVRSYPAVPALLTHLPVPAPPVSIQQPTHQLLDALESWESFGGSGPTAKGARVYAGPYSLAPIAPRPIMVDTAADEIEYPSIAHRMTQRQVEQQSTFSRLWRGWGS